MLSYKSAILFGQFAMVALIFGYRNDFLDLKRVFLRGAVAIAIGWALIISGAVLVTEIDLARAVSSDEIIRVTNGDGARHVGASLFGWVLPLLWVGLIWGAVKIIRGIRSRAAI